MMSDIGQNGVQTYALQRNEHFIFNIQTTSAGSKYGELVLDKELDREEQQEIEIIAHCPGWWLSSEIRHSSHTRHRVGR